MLIKIGHVEAIFRYPVKSMAGERLEGANLGWYGLDGDRRLAFRRMGDRSGMPWLTEANFLIYSCLFRTAMKIVLRATFPRIFGRRMAKRCLSSGEELTQEIERRQGAPVQMMQLKHGIFDETPISVIATDTVQEIGRLAGCSLDARQFRPNVVVRLLQSAAFQEDEWLGAVLSFGEECDAAAIAVTMRDERCGMVNLDPVSAKPTPEVMKAIVRVNQNYAGSYGSVTRTGRLKIGQTIFINAAMEKRKRA